MRKELEFDISNQYIKAVNQRQEVVKVSLFLCHFFIVHMLLSLKTGDNLLRVRILGIDNISPVCYMIYVFGIRVETKFNVGTDKWCIPRGVGWLML